MSEELHIDGETRSISDLKKAGAYKYFECPTTDAMCVSYSFGSDEPKIWRRGQPCPPEVVAHIENGGVITAWNASFERLMFRYVLSPRYGWPLPKDEQYRCTMTEALAMNLPGKLEHCAPALGLTTVKDDAGHRLMLVMCRPRKTQDGLVHWWDEEDKEKLEGLCEYCKQDVRTEAAIGSRVLRLIPKEREYYLLDLKINDRGVYIDDKLAKAAAYVVEKSSNKLDAEISRITDNAVCSVTAVQQIVKFLSTHGIVVESIAKEALEDLLIRDDLPDVCRRVLELRQEGSKTSTAKIKSMLLRRQSDGRMRGNIRFYGASDSGRNSGQGSQLQNLPQFKIIDGKGYDLEKNIDIAVDHVMTGNLSLIELSYDKPLTLVADCIRPMICAEKGNIQYASDFSNIEGRGAAWLARQDDKLKAFRDFDSGIGADLYLLAAAGIYNVPVKEAAVFRTTGKVSELSLQYAGGAKAFAKMTRKYGLRVASIYVSTWERASENNRVEALEAWSKRGKETGMGREAFLTSEVIKLAWRKKNDRIVACWYRLEEAAKEAICRPGEVITADRVKYKKSGSFLFSFLPSKRTLCYPYPQIVDGSIVYKSMGQFTHKWEETKTYGGKLFNNCVQGLCRDIMEEAMLRTENAGYYNTLNIHDEVLAETSENFGALQEYNAIMCELPDWAAGFPIVAAGWTGHRYRK